MTDLRETTTGSEARQAKMFPRREKKPFLCRIGFHAFPDWIVGYSAGMKLHCWRGCGETRDAGEWGAL